MISSKGRFPVHCNPWKLCKTVNFQTDNVLTFHSKCQISRSLGFGDRNFRWWLLYYTPMYRFMLLLYEYWTKNSLIFPNLHFWEVCLLRNSWYILVLFRKNLVHHLYPKIAVSSLMNQIFTLIAILTCLTRVRCLFYKECKVFTCFRTNSIFYILLLSFPVLFVALKCQKRSRPVFTIIIRSHLEALIVMFLTRYFYFA